MVIQYILISYLPPCLSALTLEYRISFTRPRASNRKLKQSGRDSCPHLAIQVLWLLLLFCLFRACDDAIVRPFEKIIAGAVNSGRLVARTHFLSLGAYSTHFAMAPVIESVLRRHLAAFQLKARRLPRNYRLSFSIATAHFAPYLFSEVFISKLM